MNWKLAEKLRQRLSKEQGYYRSSGDGGSVRFALGYPNVYGTGMSNLGLHIIYDILNRRGDTVCERFFLPEKRELAEYQRTATPIMTLENQRPLDHFDIVGLAVSFEMDYFNIPLLLDMGRVTVRAAERGEREPIVIAGGPCATFNPAVLSPVIDAFVIGEGEETVGEIIEAVKRAREEKLSRQETIRRLAAVPGVFVPALYEWSCDEQGRVTSVSPVETAVPERISRRWVKKLDDYPAHTVVVTEDTEFNLYLVETGRGCGRHCRFCMAGYAFRRPRSRSLAVLKQEISEAIKFKKRFGLMGAAISDYPEIDALCRYIRGEGQSMSVASFRADSVTPVLVKSLADSGMQTLTIAPEAGSGDMRAVINKGIEEEHLYKTIRLGVAAGIRHFRMYIMVGLPWEEMEDIEEVAELTHRLKDFMEAEGSKGTLTLSVNPFIPKPFTPFQWLPMAGKKVVEESLKRLKAGLAKRKGIEVKTESLKEAYVQGILARGDRRIGELLCRAYEDSGSGAVKVFLRVMKDAGVDAGFYLYRERGEGEIFPWEMIDIGVRREYLLQELERARERKSTMRCFDGCRRCGVCY